MSQPEQDLRGDVVEGPAEGVGLFVGLDSLLRQSEVRDLDVSVCTEKYVLRFQVSKER